MFSCEINMKLISKDPQIFTPFSGDIFKSLPHISLLICCRSLYQLMDLQSLFDRSPVLPVDTAISLARYLHTARQTQRQAVSTEQGGDIARATLLHVRVLQLICKTLPSHPDCELPENASVQRELRSVANVSFRDAERLATHLKNPSRPTRLHSHRPTRLALSASLVELFQHMSTESANKGNATLGLLAMRAKNASNTDVDEIVSLIVPSQTHGHDWSFVRYDRDVAHLLEIKDLSLVGFIAMLPNAQRATLPLQASIPLAAIQAHYPHAAAITIAPRDMSNRISAETLSENAVAYVTNVDSDMPEEIIPQDFDGGGEPVVVPARHIDRREDRTPAFKLYDLRPLASARDAHLQQSVDEDH